MNASTSAIANTDWTDADGNYETLVETNDYPHQQQALYDTYYSVVHTLLADTLLDLAALEQWHAAAQSIADPYSLTETRFVEGYAETFAGNAENNAETANYGDFHALKLMLRENGNSVETGRAPSLQGTATSTLNVRNVPAGEYV